MATVQKRELTAEERADAARLKAAWAAYKESRAQHGESLSQEWLGAETGLGKQSLIGQYLRGAIPLNLNALLAFCRVIGARPTDISPRLSTALLDIAPGTQISNYPTMVGRSDEEGEAYNRPTSGDNFESGPDIRSRRYPEISWVQAGMWTEIADNFVAGEDTDWHYCPYDLGTMGYVLRVKGSSMTAPAESKFTFPEDTLLFVNPDLDVVPGKFVIVVKNGAADQQEATFKRLVQIEGELFLEALNPSWPHRYVKVDQHHRFCGVVVFSGRPLL